jgi:hypothetical protein
VSEVFSRLRARYFAACCVVACTSSPAYVAPPMSASNGGADAAAGERGELAAAGRNAFRPLPAEPAPPERSTGCKREVRCQPEEERPPALAYPPPFERCWPEVDRGALSLEFSPKETRDARIEDAHACCYIEFRDCVRRAAAAGGPART